MMLSIRIRGALPKRILAVSEGVKEALLMYGLDPEKIAIAYHGVDAALFAPSETNKKTWRLRNNIPEQDLVFVSTARLNPQKRLERLIKAFDALRKQHDNIWLLIAGDGQLRKEIDSLVNSLESKDRIKMLGLVENVSEILQASDIFVLPSDREGLSVSLTEAMATGLICVASNVSGSNEVIENGENGFLVEPNEKGVLHGMKEILELDLPARRGIAQKGRDFILEHFEMRKSVTNILGMLDIESV